MYNESVLEVVRSSYQAMDKGELIGCLEKTSMELFQALDRIEDLEIVVARLDRSVGVHPDSLQHYLNGLVTDDTKVVRG